LRNIPISDYFNNKGFYNEDSKITADLDGYGNSINSSKLIASHSEYGLPFVEEVQPHSLDNISCLGQLLKVEKVNLSKYLYVVGLSEGGNFTGELSLQSGNCAVSKRFAFSDFMSKEKMVHEEEFLQFEGIVINGVWHKGPVCSLRLVIIDIQDDISLEGVELPYNPSIHIFGLFTN
jgi:hypothetical protein